jgi:HSP20 family protein
MSPYSSGDSPARWFYANVPNQFLAPKFRPAADVYRTRQGWLIKLELAGVRRDDIEITRQGSRLIVRGCRRDALLTEGSEYVSLEISYSKFERTLELPCDLEHCRVAADTREGMLLIEVLPEASP